MFQGMPLAYSVPSGSNWAHQFLRDSVSVWPVLMSLAIPGLLLQGRWILIAYLVVYYKTWKFKQFKRLMLNFQPLPGSGFACLSLKLAFASWKPGKAYLPFDFQPNSPQLNSWHLLGLHHGLLLRYVWLLQLVLYLRHLLAPLVAKIFWLLPFSTQRALFNGQFLTGFFSHSCRSDQYYH